MHTHIFADSCCTRCSLCKLVVLELLVGLHEKIKMSRVPPFIVGLIVSQAGYVYLSDRLVAPRNRLMQRHFGGEVAIYQPELQADIGRVRP